MVNLGKISNNSFKESRAVNVAKKTFEINNSIKTYFSEMDKRANLDGQLTILSGKYERITVDVQIKALPNCYERNNNFYYDCDTKVFNVVKEKVTQNPVVLILVDVNKEKVYYKLLTREYVLGLHIKNQVTKRINFNAKDLFNEETFITEVCEYIKIVKSNVSLYVDEMMIYDTLMKKSKPHHEDYKFVYKNGNITGYLTVFFFDTSYDSSLKLHMIKMSDGEQYEKIQIQINKEYLYVNRSIQRTSATDSDICNILYNIANIYERSLLFESAGIPTFIIKQDGCIWSLHAERVEKDW